MCHPEPFLAWPEAEGFIASAPLCFEMSLQHRLTEKLCYSLAPHSWLTAGFPRPVVVCPSLLWYACPGSSTGRRQGISAGNDLHSLPQWKEQRALQCSNLSLHSTPTSSWQEWFSPHTGIAKLAFIFFFFLCSFNFQMAFLVWEGCWGVLRVWAKLREKSVIFLLPTGERVLRMLKMKGKCSKKSSRVLIPSVWGCPDPLQHYEIVSIIWRNKMPLNSFSIKSNVMALLRCQQVKGFLCTPVFSADGVYNGSGMAESVTAHLIAAAKQSCLNNP